MTEQDHDHEVVVIGAGPTGLMAALELHRLGVPATLVERLGAPHRQTRATAVLPWSLELLEAAGATEPIVEQAVHASGADVCSPDGAVLGGYHLDGVPSRYPWFAALPQWRTEAVLRGRLAEHGGGILRGVHVAALEEHDDHVAVTVDRVDGDRERWRAGWVISATGSDATVRHALHEQLEGGEYPRHYLVADVAVDADLDHTRTAVFVGEAGLAAFLVLPEGRRLVVLDRNDDDSGTPDPAGAPDIDEVRGWLCERVTMPFAVADVTWSSCFTLHHRVAPRMATGRIFLAGDAAHVCSLFGAFGMNSGLQDAVNLAWKIALVHAGRARHALLDTYQEERHPEAVTRVAMADAMHEGIVAGIDGPADPPGAAMPSDPDAANLARCMLDVRYPRGSAVAEGTGTRFPRPDRAPRQGRYRLFVGPGVAAPDPLLRRWHQTIDAVDDETVATGAALVRPDGIVGWAADVVDEHAWSALDGHLGTVHVPG